MHTSCQRQWYEKSDLSHDWYGTQIEIPDQLYPRAQTRYQLRDSLHLKMSEQLDCALDLLRRLPPSKTTQNLAKLVQLCPEIQEELLSSVDQPLQVLTCVKTGKEFLCCDYNRDGESFRFDRLTWISMVSRVPTPNGRIQTKRIAIAVGTSLQ